MNVIVDDATHGADDRLGAVNLAAGQHTLEYVYFERSAGAAAELFSAPGSKSSFDNSFTLVGDPNGNLPLINLDELIDTDIQSQMSGQNGSVYLRYPFVEAQITPSGA